LAIASGKAQGVWLEAVEERVAVTSKVLGVMKSIKMTGLTQVISNNIRQLRSQEIKASFTFRLYTILIITFCKYPLSNFTQYLLIQVTQHLHLPHFLLLLALVFISS
jgi:hypothetical protein